MEQTETVTESNIKGVFIINRPKFSDDRGFFKEVLRLGELERKLGQKLTFVQFNHSHSKIGVLRGVHRASWAKLVYVSFGEVQEVVVDLREGSETFGEYLSINLGTQNPVAVFIPPFCGNGYLTLSDEADYVYLVTDYWQESQEISLKWDDPDLNIDWQNKNPVLSARDQDNLKFSEVFGDRMK